MPGVVDYSAARPNPQSLKQLGFAGVVRYGCRTYRPDTATLTAGEYQALKAAGLDVAMVIEFSADWLLEGYAAGKQIATVARAEERAMGMPDGLSFAACDFDITLGGPPVSAQAVGNCQRALDTLHGMADGYGGWQYVAPYGSRWFCDWATQHSPMTRSWPTQAWSWVNGQGFQPSANGVLWQYASWPSGVPYVDGCDFNLVRAADWGQRRPAPIPPITPPIPAPGGDMAFKTLDLTKQYDFASAPIRTLRGLLSAWEIRVDGVLISPDDNNSDRTRKGVVQFKQKAGLPANMIVDSRTWNILLGFVKA